MRAIVLWYFFILLPVVFLLFYLCLRTSIYIHSFSFLVDPLLHLIVLSISFHVFNLFSIAFSLPFFSSLPSRHFPSLSLHVPSFTLFLISFPYFFFFFLSLLVPPLSFSYLCIPFAISVSFSQFLWYIHKWMYIYIYIYLYVALTLLYLYGIEHSVVNWKSIIYIYMYMYMYIYIYIYIYIFWLLINRMWGLYGKVFAWDFRTDRATKERSLCWKNRGQILSRTDRTNEVNKEFIIWLLASFFIAFNEAFCLWVSGLGLLTCFYLLNRGFWYLFL